MFTSEQAVAWMEASGRVIDEQATALTRLDAAIGDGDHGTNMARGFRAVLQRLTGLPSKDFATLFKGVGMALISTVGGAAGPLYGSFFLAVGKRLGDVSEASDTDLAEAL